MSNALVDLFDRLDLTHPECRSFIGPGWLPSLERTLVDCLAYDRRLQVAQVKQKYRQCVIYIDNVLPEVEWIVADNARLCASLCELCGSTSGKPTVLRAAWQCVLCDTCKTLRRIPYLSIDGREDE